MRTTCRIARRVALMVRLFYPCAGAISVHTLATKVLPLQLHPFAPWVGHEAAV